VKALVERYSASIKEWKRPNEIEGKEPSLWGLKGISPMLAAQQGKLGDNWFLSAAAAVAEQPDFIRDMFVIQKFNDAGIFAIKFFVKG